MRAIGDGYLAISSDQGAHFVRAAYQVLHRILQRGDRGRIAALVFRELHQAYAPHSETFKIHWVRVEVTFQLCNGADEPYPAGFPLSQAGLRLTRAEELAVPRHIKLGQIAGDNGVRGFRPGWRIGERTPDGLPLS
jgi:hypothetical protein